PHRHRNQRGTPHLARCVRRGRAARVCRGNAGAAHRRTRRRRAARLVGGGRRYDRAVARTGGAEMTDAMSLETKPLKALRVLDLAWVVAGPVIGRALADFGATVLRVESSKRIETARMMGPFPGGKLDPQKSALFENCNAGKFGLTLDLSREEGRAVIRDLVQGWADIVIESFSPGQMADWGL